MASYTRCLTFVWTASLNSKMASCVVIIASYSGLKAFIGLKNYISEILNYSAKNLNNSHFQKGDTTNNVKIFA